MKRPTPGQICRHRKHDPAAGKWHEYRVVGIVQPFPETPGEGMRTSFLLPTVYRHTETDHKHVLTGCGTSIFTHGIEEAHVAYKSTRPDLCDPEWRWCLRPLDMFMDGRFTLVDPMQELVDQAQGLGLGYE